MSNLEKIEYLKSLPQKIIAVGILLFDDEGKLLILKPSYKDDWSIPGGVVEKGESPIEALKRETMEEIGFVPRIDKLLIVDTKAERILNYLEDSIQMIFLGKKLSLNEIREMEIDNKEIVDFKFVELEKAKKILSAKIFNRIEKLKGNFEDCVFLKNGVQE